MRKKIKQIAYGTFDNKETGLSFSTECVELEVIEGKDIAGEFSVRSNDGKKLRGMVYSTHPRMECLTPQFEGEEIRIHYQFHSEGLVEGDVRKGEFVIVCDQGEYNLSFVVSISRAYADTSIGVIKSMSDFARLAQESFSEAYQVFYSVGFSNLLKHETEKEKLLYEAVRKEAPTFQAVEAYLTGIGKKPAVKVTLEETTAEFTGVTASKKEQICLKKDNWGYVSCNVWTDADFIRLEKTELTSDDFIGSTCFFDYYIEAEALHGGKNFGRITFAFPECSLNYEVTITGREACAVSEGKKHSRYLKYKMKLTQLYIDYRTKKIVTGVWARSSIEILEHLLDEEPENDLYLLMKAQAFLVNRQRQEASWILDDYKHSGADKNTPEWGYYLYLCTLMEREESYVNRLTEQIEEIFRLYPDNSLLFWTLLFLREDYYKNSTRRLKAIENWVEKGCDSPFFYLEAFYLYWQDPYLLNRLDSFEIKVLNWARKYQAISKEIAAQILELIPTARSCDEKVFHILEACYEVADKEEVAAAICSYLIKGQRFGKKYHKWYVIGIEKEVRITSLYEAYLLSADADSIEQVPKVIFMYFQYHNTLSHKQLALLYAYIIKNKEKYKKVYQNYRRTMEQFAMCQIEAGHIDENMAVVYKEMLPLGILNEELAEKLADVLFVHKLQITGEKQFARAIVVQKQWKHRQIVPVIDGVAYFKAFSEDYSIVLQDTKGLLFAEEMYYEEKPLLEAKEYLEMAGKLAPYTVPYLVHIFAEKQKAEQFEVTDEAGFSVLMNAQEVKKEWKALLQPAFIRQIAANNAETQAEGILKNADYSLMSPGDRCYMIEQLIENHMFEQAYEMLQRYGYDSIGIGYRVTICSYQIANMEYEEDEFLLGFASDTFISGKYNDVILNYLCRYYNGATKQMAEVWKTAKDFDVDTFDMEERIITQMLYAGVYVEQKDDIYEEYCKKGGKDLIVMAYLSCFAYLYLSKEMEVSEQIFLQIEHRILLHKEVADVQNLALLKYYVTVGKLTDSQYRIADELLLKYTSQEIYFAFYKKLDKRLVTKYQFYDKYFVEYHTKPGACVGITYCINENKQQEEKLTEVYDGIFVKDFVMFFDDRLSYCIWEMDEQKERKAVSSEQVKNPDVCDDREYGCYGMLNAMLKNAASGEEEEIKCVMKEYNRKRYCTEKMFQLL